MVLEYVSLSICISLYFILNPNTAVNPTTSTTPNHRSSMGITVQKGKTSTQTFWIKNENEAQKHRIRVKYLDLG